MAQKTPLYNDHIAAGGKMVDFAGWILPVQYMGLREEHQNVRQHVGLFDVSHMGEIRIRGERALEAVDWLTTNTVARLENGQAQYTLMANEQGGIVDDLIVYCMQKGRDYLLCVNAANKDKDYEWMRAHNKGAEIVDESEMWGQVAVQGPKALALLEAVFGTSVTTIPHFGFKELAFSGATCIVARTGYTGEDGCEVFVPQAQASSLWKTLLQEGKRYQVQPCGLGARDTLRTEMKYSLYGHEIDDQTNPYAAGLGWVVKPQLKDFVGKEQILACKEQSLARKLIGFKMLEKAIPRQGYHLVSFDNDPIGVVTSGTLSPSLNQGIGIAYVDKNWAGEDSEFLVQIRHRQFKAKVVKTPFVNVGGA